MSSESTQDAGLSPEAVTKLLEARRQFLSFLEKRVRSRADAEDLLQSAFVRGIEKGGSVRDGENIVAWFYRVLRNAIVDYHRQRGAAERASTSLIAQMEDHQEPDEFFRAEVCRCVMTLLDNVKSEYREALLTVDLNDGSLAELASKAGITSNNAAVRVHRAREALRSQVTKACGICAEHGCIDCDCRHGGR
jgi:RNA polymerase sigma-70 factor (ECF subfamily)